MPKLLIADDEKEIVELLKFYLEKDHMTIFNAHDGQEALRIFEEEEIDLIILDIMMPKIDGFQLTKAIREKSNVPIMILSAKTEATDKIYGLDLGADDYISKPFDALEVVARVRANLRRLYDLGNDRKMKGSLKVADLELDLDRCILIRDMEEIELTSVEFKVLFLFMNSPGQVFSKEQIYEAGWKNADAVDDNTIRVSISKLRNKVGESRIHTIRGLGYRMEK